MFDIADLIERAKQAENLQSDYALSKRIGVTRASVSSWLHGKSLPDERAIVQLCSLTGDDPVMVFLQVQHARAANDDARGLWAGLAERLGQAPKSAVIAVAAAGLLSALTPRHASAFPVSDVCKSDLTRTNIAFDTRTGRSRPSAAGARRQET